MNWNLINSETAELFCKAPTLKALELGEAEYRAIIIASLIIAFFTGKRLAKDFSRWFGK